jgi:hypothetical protein
VFNQAIVGVGLFKLGSNLLTMFFDTNHIAANNFTVMLVFTYNSG